ncbi:hypothetical protein BJV82DRAFT_594300 [Fennellomyces sp. T-0311]|nr:hypothetical protein BJV82DRAFT_594300 [Fennellomyces sp. T-0311]
MTSWLNNVDDAQLRESVEQLISAYPDSLPVVQRLINYYHDKLARVENDKEEEEREHKKRKIDRSPTTDIVATMVDISFLLPARKKYNLILTTHQLILVNPKTDQVEHTFDLSKVQIGVCVPSPAPTKGHTLTLFFAQPDTDPICFSIQQQNTIQRADDTLTVEEENHKHAVLTQLLMDQGVRVTQPSKTYFTSTLVSATTGKRSEEDRFYANGYLKAKEGCLYFLPEGVLYGFKKPVSFYPLSCLASTFYSGITQHTFNLSLVLHKGHRPLGSAFINIKEDEETTVEFSMIEQSEYGGIDGYIKKVGVNDKSMSEENMAPETKARTIQQNTPPNEDEDEESDHDFQPSDGDVDPLEYDSDAGSLEEDDVMDEDHDHSDAIEQESDIDEPRLASSDPIVASDDAAEQDITRTDNESDDEEEEEEEEELQATEDDVEEEEEVAEEDEEDEEEEDDARSESLGSSSEEDIDEDMHEAVIAEDAKDELDDSD